MSNLNNASCGIGFHSTFILFLKYPDFSLPMHSLVNKIMMCVNYVLLLYLVTSVTSVSPKYTILIH
jgi:hypothetical protein